MREINPNFRLFLFRDKPINLSPGELVVIFLVSSSYTNEEETFLEWP